MNSRPKGASNARAAGKKRRILFVCLGNICRSPAAEGIFRLIVEEHGEAEEWTIDSAGIGDWHTGQLPDKRMQVHAQRRGLELTHHARQVRTTERMAAFIPGASPPLVKTPIRRTG